MTCLARTSAGRRLGPPARHTTTANLTCFPSHAGLTRGRGVRAKAGWGGRAFTPSHPDMPHALERELLLASLCDASLPHLPAAIPQCNASQCYASLPHVPAAMPQCNASQCYASLPHLLAAMPPPAAGALHGAGPTRGQGGRHSAGRAAAPLPDGQGRAG